MNDWRRVVFSNESRFVLYQKRRIREDVQYSYRKISTSMYRSSVQQGGEGIMVWGCITFEGPDELKVIDGTMNN